MKLQVTQENLSRALNTVARVASTRGTLPILANVLIKTIDNRVSISATNLDVAITQFIGAKIIEPGSITLPARLMQDYIASLPSGVVELELDDQKLHIKSDKYQSTINGVPADDFPEMPAIINGGTVIIPSEVLKAGLQQTIPAAGSDDARPVLTGMYMHTDKGQLYLVATDSYRLAEKKVYKTAESISLLIPASAAQDVLRVLVDETKDVSITYDEQQVQFLIGDIKIVSRLIDGTYPNYRGLIPSSFENIATLLKSDFVSITKVSSLFARESAGSVTLQLDSDQRCVRIHSIASQVGENTAQVDADVSGNGSITLNSRYILDALSAIKGDEIVLSFNGKLEPCVLKDSKNKDYLHVIMPLKS